MSFLTPNFDFSFWICYWHDTCAMRVVSADLYRILVQAVTRGYSLLRRAKSSGSSLTVLDRRGSRGSFPQAIYLFCFLRLHRYLVGYQRLQKVMSPRPSFGEIHQRSSCYIRCGMVPTRGCTHSSLEGIEPGISVEVRCGLFAYVTLSNCAMHVSFCLLEESTQYSDS